ncbi:DNA-binding response regulator [Cupriavidus sp. TA19]|uniref:LuxR C-terminal-related transcriptional regulator n=1 Tax=Cupriavidus sp. TA19 TaxID=701108 RepID=UPI0027294665|nr:response regulator transcription factor [Cupriavidus sp. TA19]GLC93599.1 DNA-binding response regulator [Cupriavidus sp. TA19]
MNPTIANKKPALSGSLLLVGHEKRMRARLCAILSDLAYTADALACTSCPDEVNALLVERPFDMALVDSSMSTVNGIDLIRAMHAHDPRLPIVVISDPAAEADVIGALRAGASGYLLKESDDTELSVCLRSALRGGMPIDPFIARLVLQSLVAAEPQAACSPPTGRTRAAASGPLSARELDILRCIDRGATNREIAAALSLSKLTIESHVKNIHKKLGVKTRTQATFEARRYGLLN